MLQGIINLSRFNVTIGNSGEWTYHNTGPAHPACIKHEIKCQNARGFVGSVTHA